MNTLSNFEVAVKAEAKKVIRCWQKYTSEQRSDLAAASLKYKAAWGEFYYVHPAVPGKAFPRRKDAARAAVEAGGVA